jgi:nicotinamide-nucleotide amidase
VRAEIISIGDELTSGQRLDTNSQWLALRLGELGVRTLFHTTVGDDLEANVEVFRRAIERVEIVVATGGLGPTADDLTRDALAQAVGVPLVLDEPTLAHIEGLFARRGRTMAPSNRNQAMFPAGSRIVRNPAGTAPGIDLDARRGNGRAARVFALPGVPAEMQEMWNQSVEPAIRAMGGGDRVICHRRIKCFGAGESDLEAMLPDLIRRGRTPSVGITVHGATITLRITAEAESRAACETLMAPTVEVIQQCLGDLVFGEEEDELQDAVVRLLRAKNKTVAVAEWGTAGTIAHWLSEVPQSSDCFLGGMVLPNIRAVHHLVQPTGRATISESLPDEEGYMKLIVEQMSQACREAYSADFGLSVGELPGSAAGKVWMAVASELKTTAVSAPVLGHPEIHRVRAAKQALNLLRKAIF